MKKLKKNKKIKRLIFKLSVIAVFSLLSVIIYCIIGLLPVSNNDTIKEVSIEKGSIESIAITLKENKIIRNVTIFKLYIRLTNKTNLKTGIYEFSESMSIKKIVNTLEKGSKISPHEASITFKEGVNVRKIASLIDEKTNNNYDDVINTITDSAYIDELIDKYWFLTDDIKNKDIYYPLEGYLYPNTYRFDKDATVKEILEDMLDEEDKKLTKYKTDIENSSLSIHEIITFSSIVELEVANSSDRKDVAGIIYNRLDSKYFPTLGMDTTSYYGAKIDDWKTNKVTSIQLEDCSNKYNTRCKVNVGLPIGPICSPSIESILAALYPNKHDYYYFVNDCDGVLYMSKTDTEHNNTIYKLKKDKNWCS